MSKGIILNKERNVILTPFLTSNADKVTFLLLPGGSYSTCDISEVEPAAKLFNSKGYNCFALQYSVGKHYKWPYPLEDYETAIQYLYDHSGDYGITPTLIVVIGFSAGGHLAAMAASDERYKPYAAAVLYGATNASTIDYNAPGAPDANDAVNENTCPCFIASSRNDWIVPVNNTMNFMAALNKYDIDYEAHIYGYSMHGFNIGADFGAKPPLFNTHCGNWVNDFLAWLGELTSGQYVSIRERCEYNDAHSESLSSMNSNKVIFDSPEAASLIKKRFPIQYALYLATRKKVGSFTDGVSFKNVLQLLKAKEETIEKINKALSEIKNGAVK
ncbi:MAG: alpha/beta hydrolase [Clostridia bacterium]|nr:alpha/beta hydrolase [Clostridia bacterium]